MDETVINGANLFFASQLGIPQEGPDQSRNEWLLGLVNGAPYVRSFFNFWYRPSTRLNILLALLRCHRVLVDSSPKFRSRS